MRDISSRSEGWGIVLTPRSNKRHALPLRVDAYNNLVNQNSALKDRGHVLMIESIPPVAAGSGCDV